MNEFFAPPKDADPINQCTNSSNTSVEKSDIGLLSFTFKYMFLLQYSIFASKCFPCAVKALCNQRSG